MKIKKSIKFLVPLALCSVVLTACNDEPTESNLKRDTTAMIGSKAKPVASPKLVDTRVPHTINFKGKKIKVVATYGIEKRFVHNWKFCSNEMVNLAIKPVSDDPAVKIGVNNIYSDVSVSSDRAKYDGVRQDSVNMNYNAMPDGMVLMSKTEPYDLPFQVESIVHNETSYYILNNYYIKSNTDRITESDMRQNSDGAKLNVVWTLAIKDHEGTYFKTINDTIGIPYK